MKNRKERRSEEQNRGGVKNRTERWRSEEKNRGGGVKNRIERRRSEEKNRGGGGVKKRTEEEEE